MRALTPHYMILLGRVKGTRGRLRCRRFGCRPAIRSAPLLSITYQLYYTLHYRRGDWSPINIIYGKGKHLHHPGFRSSAAPHLHRAPHRKSSRGPSRCIHLTIQNKTVRVAHDSYNHMEIKFDQAFDPDKEQADIYSHFKEIVPKVLTGYNLTIFAYGQTGSGKTYTMFGKIQNE